MNAALNVIRFPRGSTEYSNFVEASDKWNSQFVFLTKSEICLSNARGLAAPEYLKDKFKVTNGIIAVEIHEFSFEINEVKEGRIRALKTVHLSELSAEGVKLPPSEEEISERLLEALEKFCPNLAETKVVVGTERELSSPRGGEWYVASWQRAPIKYEYQLAGKVHSARSSARIRNFAFVVLAMIGVAFLYFVSSGEETVVEKVVKKSDPLKGYYEVLHGKLPSVRQALQETVNLIEVIDKISGWKYREINFQQNPNGSMIVSAVLIKKEEAKESKSTLLKIDLMNVVSQYGYYMDLQRPDPVIFKEFKNHGVYTAGYDSIPPVNIDQSVAYLSDAVTSIVRRSNLTSPPANESARVSNGAFQERPLILELNGNYKNHLDYISIIFSGWPVVFVGGKVDSIDANGKFKSRFTLTILGK